MRFVLASALTAAVLAPAMFLSGYVLNSPPSLQATIERELKLVPQSNETEDLYVVTKGNLRGQVAPGLVVAIQYNVAQLRAMGALQGHYVRRTCKFYSESGDPLDSTTAQAVTRCTQYRITKAQVLKRLETAGAPAAGSGAPVAVS